MWGNPLEGEGLGKFINKLPKCKLLDIGRCYMKEEDLVKTSMYIENKHLQVNHAYLFMIFQHFQP